MPPRREALIVGLGALVTLLVFPLPMSIVEGNLGTYEVLREPWLVGLSLPAIAASIMVGRWRNALRRRTEAVSIALLLAWVLVSLLVFGHVRSTFKDDGVAAPIILDLVGTALVVLLAGVAGWICIGVLVVLPSAAAKQPTPAPPSVQLGHDVQGDRLR